MKLPFMTLGLLLLTTLPSTAQTQPPPVRKADDAPDAATQIGRAVDASGGDQGRREKLERWRDPEAIRWLKDPELARQVKELTDSLAKAVQELDRLKAQAGRDPAAAKAAVEALGVIRDALDRRDQEVAQLKRELAEQRERARTAEAAARAAQKKAAEQEARLAEIARIAAGKVPPAKAGRPAGVEGKVVAMASSGSGLVQVDIGTDAGLKVGDTLEAYRPGKQAQHLGEVTVLTVSLKAAVGKFESKPRSAIQIGDQVKAKMPVRKN